MTWTFHVLQKMSHKTIITICFHIWTYNHIIEIFRACRGISIKILIYGWQRRHRHLILPTQHGCTTHSGMRYLQLYFTKIDWFHKCIFSQEMAIFGKIKKKFLILKREPSHLVTLPAWSPDQSAIFSLPNFTAGTRVLAARKNLLKWEPNHVCWRCRQRQRECK